MIIESILNSFSSALKLIFGWINLPDVPPEIADVINQLFGYTHSGIGLVFLFVPMPLVRILLPLVVVVVNYSIYSPHLFFFVNHCAGKNIILILSMLCVNYFKGGDISG
ncbi:hypothetical protein LBYZC6_18280 [Lacrimispora brassicae]